MEADGYTVLTAGSWDEAVHTTRQSARPIRLLLVDLFLPEQLQLAKHHLQTPTANGLRLARQLTSLKPQMATIFLASTPDWATQARGVPTDAVVLLKPVSCYVLMETIRQVLDGAPVTRACALVTGKGR